MCFFVVYLLHLSDLPSVDETSDQLWPLTLITTVRWLQSSYEGGREKPFLKRSYHWSDLTPVDKTSDLLTPYVHYDEIVWHAWKNGNGEMKLAAKWVDPVLNIVEVIFSLHRGESGNCLRWIRFKMGCLSFRKPSLYARLISDNGRTCVTKLNPTRLTVRSQLCWLGGGRAYKDIIGPKIRVLLYQHSAVLESNPIPLIDFQ